MALIYLTLIDGRRAGFSEITSVMEAKAWPEGVGDPIAAQSKAAEDAGGCEIVGDDFREWVRDSFDEVKAKIEAAAKYGDPESAAFASWKRAGDEVFRAARQICDSTSWLPTIGENIKVRRFARFRLGEGIEKKESDFAAEVMAQVQG